jgi:hypothetical protein
MSASGTKQTSKDARGLVAFDPKRPWRLFQNNYNSVGRWGFLMNDLSRPVLAVVLAITITLGSALTVLPSLAQELPFARLVDLVTRKGDLDVQVGQLCHEFGISGENPNGLSIQMPWMDDKDRSHHLFNIFVGNTGKQRILLVSHDTKVAYAFLTGPRATPEAVAKGDKNPTSWTWTRISFTPQLSALLQKEVTYWKSIEAEVAKEPDRKN